VSNSNPNRRPPKNGKRADGWLLSVTTIMNGLFTLADVALTEKD